MANGRQFMTSPVLKIISLMWTLMRTKTKTSEHHREAFEICYFLQDAVFVVFVVCALVPHKTDGF